MIKYNISKTFPWHDQVTEKSSAVMRMFGLTADSLTEKSIGHNCCLEIEAGDIVYITGPSGSGKSVLLRSAEEMTPIRQRINLNQIALESNKTVIDCIDGDLLDSLKLLNSAGLNDCLCILNTPANLSDGQKWRFRLAMALAAGKKFIFADEFCTNLDRICASVIAHNIHRFAKHYGVTFFLASSHEDILLDLSPDVLIVKELSGPAEVIYKNAKL